MMSTLDRAKKAKSAWALCSASLRIAVPPCSALGLARLRGAARSAHQPRSDRGEEAEVDAEQRGELAGRQSISAGAR